MFRLLASEWNEPIGDGKYVRHVRGDVVDVPDEHRDRLLKARAIEPATGAPEAPEADQAEAGTDVDDSADPVEADAGDVEDAAGAEEEAAPADRPLRTASKATWVDYAVARGFDRAEADGMTRAELIEALGEE